MSRVTEGGLGHCLYISWGFPPARGSGVYRQLATANALADRGWRVTVVACAVEDLRRYTGLDESLLEAVDPRITVRRVPFDLGPVETDLRRYSRLRATRPQLWKRWYEWRKRWQFPENLYGAWKRPLLREVRAVQRQDPVNLVVVSAAPYVGLSAALLLHGKHGVPFVVDHRDSWSMHVFTGERQHAPDSKAFRIEAKVMHEAGDVWFVNEPIRRWYEATFPQIVGKTRVVLNGYDPLYIDLDRQPDPASLTFGYVGTISTAVPLMEFLDGWRKARGADERLANARAVFRGYLNFYATPNWRMSQAFATAAADGVEYGGPVPKSQVGDAYGGFDALLLVLGAGRYATSGKVFEYMATGVPIVSVHSPENAVREILDGYPLWFPADALDPDSIASALSAAAAATVDGDRFRPARAAGVAYAQQFERHRQLESPIAALDRHGRRHARS